MLKWFLTPVGLLALYLLGVNLAAFFAMGWDKRCAKRPGKRHIPEKRLFLLSLLGGALGGLIGGRTFEKVPVKWLKVIFGLFLLYGGVRYLI